MIDHSLAQNLLWVLSIGLVGGLFAKLINLPVVIGYIIGGFIAAFLPIDPGSVHGLSEIGLILLLFSVGIELSLEKLTKLGSLIVIAALVQIFIVTILLLPLNIFVGFGFIESLILAIGFSLSSTAVVVKMLEDRAETESIHGSVMIAWLLTQDLFVIPVLALIPVLGNNSGNILAIATQSVVSAMAVMALVFFLGKMFVPYIIHSIAAANSRELLVLISIILAIGTAYLVSIFGISAALGAFLAGVVISETQENHAVFSETRPLRDIFVIIFFVTLGFYVEPTVLISNIVLVLLLSICVLAIKILVVFFILYAISYRGKTAIISALGLSQIGEFSFVLFLAAGKLGIIDSSTSSIGISVTLISLIISPFVFNSSLIIWKKLKALSYKYKLVQMLITPTDLVNKESKKNTLKKHVVICGYGRVGRWVAKALKMSNVAYLVIDYNQQVVHELMLAATPVIYGDPAEDSIIKMANLSEAKAIVIAIPDKTTQEEVITYCKTHHPSLHIYARAHLNEDLKSLSQFKVEKVVQPEFEAALSIVREIMKSNGKTKSQIKSELTQLKRMHTIGIQS